MLKAHIVKQRRDLLINVALELEPGSAVGLFGASGVGKSTVLACIAGIEQPDDGFVQLNGHATFSAVVAPASAHARLYDAGARPLPSPERE